MSRTLKEQMDRDIAVFFNPKEFGEEMMVNGVPCLGIWDEDKETPVKIFPGMGWEDTPGVSVLDEVLYLARQDGGPIAKPAPTQELHIDNEVWTVRDSKLEGGILKLLLYQSKA